MLVFCSGLEDGIQVPQPCHRPQLSQSFFFPIMFRRIVKTDASCTGPHVFLTEFPFPWELVEFAICCAAVRISRNHQVPRAFIPVDMLTGQSPGGWTRAGV